MRPTVHTSYGWLVLQLLGTFLVLIAIPSTLMQALLLLVWWAVTFGPLDRREAVFFVLACAFFTGMNALALRQGIFAFATDDVLGMPWYELFMWGFYGLHLWRLIGGPAPQGNRFAGWVLAGLFAICFAVVADPWWLLMTTALVLVVSLLYFHDRWDLAYLSYAASLGAMIEYAGVWSGQWRYPGDPVGGVPLWFVTMWAGVGLFLRRLVVPALVVNHPISASERLRLPLACTRGWHSNGPTLQ